LTPDQSLKEQMSITIRFVDIKEEVSLREHFVGFIVVEDSTGQGLTNAFLDELQKCNLEIRRSRQQLNNASKVKTIKNHPKSKLRRPLDKPLGKKLQQK